MKYIKNMTKQVSFANIRPLVRFSATQNLFNSGSFLIDQEVVAYDNRIYYCIQGTGTLFINNEKYNIKPHTIVIWKSNLKYRCIPLSEDFTCITANFDYFYNENSPIKPIPPQGTKYFEEEKITEKDIFFEDNELFNNIIYIEDIPEADIAMREIVKTYREGFNFDKLFLSGLMSILFKIVIEHNQKHNTYSNKHSIHHIVTYIHDHYHENITNISIAKLFNYHPNYLSRLFLEHTGYTLHNYIIKYRLSRAVKLLMSTDLSILEICETVNILDQHYFSRIFKKYYKVSPSKFRQKV